jgi:CheY-like chemotaxis protein
VRRGVEAIERNARAQVKLIDELLDMSRIISGRMRLDVHQVALSEVVQSALDSIVPAAQAKGVELETSLDPLAGPISGDPVRLQQVVWNLLSNAMKFTPRGGRVRVVQERADPYVKLTISDTGVGISREFLPHVFDRFSQQNSSISRSYGGLGLGLAIAKQLVELHGGTLQAASAGEGKGASFVVQLPIFVARSNEQHVLAACEPAAEPHPLLPDLRGIRVLVLDDEADARELVRNVLDEQGAAVTAVASGEEALKKLEAIGPHIVLSDVGMPEMDGYQFIRSLRASASRYSRVPAIAVTAFARVEDGRKAKLAGYQSHLAKPFDIAELVTTVANLADRAGRD